MQDKTITPQEFLHVSISRIVASRFLNHCMATRIRSLICDPGFSTSRLCLDGPAISSEVHLLSAIAASHEEHAMAAALQTECQVDRRLTSVVGHCLFRLDAFVRFDDSTPDSASD
jgi:hypothetical protein